MKKGKEYLPPVVKDVVDMFFAQKQLYERGTGTYVPPTFKVENESGVGEVTGIVTELKVKGQDHPTIITVEYRVDGVDYYITESLKMKSEKIKIGFLPVGQKKVPVIKNAKVGGSVSITYNLSNPAEAYITQNKGFANI